MIKLTNQQQLTYDRFIRARDKVFKRKGDWIRQADITSTIDITGMNHPLYEDNPEYAEYKDAFKQWLAIEPEFRKLEKMSAIRGDYGTSDDWDEKPSKIKELV